MNKKFFPVVALILSAGAINAVVAQTNKPMMKAIVIHQYGGPEALKYEDAPRPEPKDNQVLVKVIAAAVNPVDAMIRSGKYAKVFGTTLPLIPGYDIAGIVEKSGAKVTRFKPGDAIYAYPMWGGGYAEYDLVVETKVDQFCGGCGRSFGGVDCLAGAN